MYKVLLVDDEPAAIAMERRIIENRTDDFVIPGKAYSVDSALKLYEELKPEIVLTDMKMPGRSGVELIGEIMQRENDHTICVAVSGFSDFDYVHDAFSNGAFDYLLKPIDPEKMEELFRKIRLEMEKNSEPAGADHDPAGKVSDQEMVKKIENYILSHLSENNSIPAICNEFGISQPYLSRIFKAVQNCTYNEFLTGIRIGEAGRMLRSERFNVGEIAERTGYNSQFYFSRVFKNVTGFTPTEYSRMK